MVFNTEKGKHVENSVGTSDEFQIKADEKLFMLLSDSVYSDKIAAGIREITCNAYDAHIEAGQERKFQGRLRLLGTHRRHAGGSGQD